MPPLFPPKLKRDLTATITLENCQFDIKSNSYLPYDPAIPFLRYLLKGNEEICPPKDWYKNIPRCFNFQSPTLEITQMIINRRRDTQNVVYSNSVILLINKKELP